MEEIDQLVENAALNTIFAELWGGHRNTAHSAALHKEIMEFMLGGPRGDTHRSILLIQFSSPKHAWKWRYVRPQVYSVIFMVFCHMGYTELDLWLTEFIERYSTRMYTRIHYWVDETENLQSI